MFVVKALGSLRFALFLIAALAALLGVSTVTESLHGTPFAQKIFYSAGWFDVFLALVWVNIFCATLTRWPFKKQHIGFVLTHIGILTLLLGALLSRLGGVEGQMALFEGEEKNMMLQPGTRLTATDGSLTRSWELPAGGYPRRFVWKEVGVDIEVSRFLPHSVVSRTLSEGAAGDPVNHAVQARLSSEAVGIDETFELLENDPEDPHAHFKNIGPARFTLKSGRAAPSGSATLVVREKKNGRAASVPLGGPVTLPYALGDGGLRITALRYYPHAKIRDNAVVEDAASMPVNPAVELEITDAGGRAEHHTRFALFPDFASLRGGPKHDMFGLDVLLEMPPAEPGASHGAAFNFLYAPEGWSYEVRSSKHAGASAQRLEARQKIPTGWMDMQVEALRLFERARIGVTIKADPRKASEEPAAHVTLKGAGHEKSGWVFAGRPLVSGDKPVHVWLEPQSVALPFSIALSDFRKIDYPGTSSPSAFESDVLVRDPDRKTTAEKRIFMNHPLDHRGFRVFQSSFMQDDAQGEGSVFTIAKNPGIGFIYTGAVIILIGVLLLFYLHPFFNGRTAPRKRRPRHAARQKL